MTLRVSKEVLRKAGLLAILSIPVAGIYLLYKIFTAKPKPVLNPEERYDDEHLGIG